jgi:hypothetical protein
MNTHNFFVGAPGQVFINGVEVEGCKKVRAFVERVAETVLPKETWNRATPLYLSYIPGGWRTTIDIDCVAQDIPPIDLPVDFVAQNGGMKISARLRCISKSYCLQTWRLHTTFFGEVQPNVKVFDQ